MARNSTSSPTMKMFGVSVGDGVSATVQTTGICGLHSKGEEVILKTKLVKEKMVLFYPMVSSDLLTCQCLPTWLIYLPFWGHLAGLALGHHTP